MSEIRKIKSSIDNRIETGPLQINDDWPGTFLRGDDSAHFAMWLDIVLSNMNKTENLNDEIARTVLEGLRNTLQSCNINNIDK